jgi:hypothetical protein
MSATDPNLAVIAAAIVLFLAVLAAIYIQKRRKSDRLKQRFGPEYVRTVDQLGDCSRAEADLAAREKRVDRLHITPLSAADAARFRLSWNTLQGRFVDSPKGAVVQADQLVCELMQKRGYPMGDFERRAADISVDHPEVVANYRAARDIALRDKRGESTTEDLRKAVVHYRALFDELLEVDQKPSLAPTRERERFSVQS